MILTTQDLSGDVGLCLLVGAADDEKVFVDFHLSHIQVS